MARSERAVWGLLQCVAVTTLVAGSVFGYTMHLVLLILQCTFKRHTNWCYAMPQAFCVAGVVCAAAAAATMSGLFADRIERRRPVAVALPGMAAAGAVIWGLHEWGAWWTRPVAECRFTLWARAGILAAVGVVAWGSIAAARHRRGRCHYLPGGAGATQEAAGGTSALSNLRLHAAILTGVWMLGGFLTYGGPQELLAVLGTSLFVLHAYPRTTLFPTTNPLGNLWITLPAGYFLWVAMRDVPRLMSGELVGPYAEWTQAGGLRSLLLLCGHHLDKVSALVLTAATAVGCSLVLNAVASARLRPRYGPALHHGGLSLLAIAPLILFTKYLQFLPVMLLLLLYSFYLFASGAAFRPFFRGVVLSCSWVPVVALAQYSAHAVPSLLAGTGVRALWIYTAGSSDPFLWHDSLGIGICVMLPLTYALAGTGQPAKNRLLFRAIGILLLSTLAVTFARGAWIALAVQLLVAAFWIGERRHRIASLGLVSLVVVALVAQLLGVLSLQDLLGREGGDSSRLLETKLAWQVMRERPLVGVSPVEWDLRRLAAGTRIYGVGAPIMGWLQVPIEGGALGCLLLLALVSTVGRKVARVIANTRDPAQRLLLKAAVLSIIGVGVANCFGAPLNEEGAYLVGILLGAILGYGRAQTASPDPVVVPEDALAKSWAT